MAGQYIDRNGDSQKMILVLLGTQNNSFVRLLDAIQECIESGIIEEKVVVQAGFTKYKSKKMDIFSMIDKEDYNKLIDEANFVICHGGVGSIISCLSKEKKVIVVPRLKKYGEHVNDHQIQIARKFEQDGYVKCVLNMKYLGRTINQIEKFNPKKYESEESNVLSIVEDFIDNN